MSSKRALRRKQCDGKARHAEQAGARIALRRLREMHGHTGQLSPYHCPHCGGWHVGHTPGANGIGSGWGINRRSAR